jgi:NAD-dependent DNA ligase
MTPNKMLAYYLMSCYLYYKHDLAVLSDSDFDELSRELLEHWDEVTHQHKHLVCIDDLKAGTGYAIQYTHMIENAAMQWYRENKKAP